MKHWHKMTKISHNNRGGTTTIHSQKQMKEIILVSPIVSMPEAASCNYTPDGIHAQVS